MKGKKKRATAQQASNALGLIGYKFIRTYCSYQGILHAVNVLYVQCMCSANLPMTVGQYMLCSLCRSSCSSGFCDKDTHSLTHSTLAAVGVPSTRSHLQYHPYPCQSQEKEGQTSRVLWGGTGWGGRERVCGGGGER